MNTIDMASNNLLKDYQNAPPLPMEFSADGKSLVNLPGPMSACYDEFPQPIESSNNGFDFHSASNIMLEFTDSSSLVQSTTNRTMRNM